MAVLEDLATYLDTQTAWTIGTDLIIGDMPPDPDAITALYRYAGAPPVEVFGNDDTPPIRRPRVQVITRAGGDTGHPDAEARALLAYAKLVLIANENVNGVYYERVAALQDPFFLTRDETDRVLFACNFEVFGS